MAVFKKIYIVPIFLLLFSCTNNKVKEDNQTATDTTIEESATTRFNNAGNVKVDTKQKLLGQWKEHWGIGMETNVNSSDIFLIKLASNGKLNITCPNKKKFAIDQVLFDGKELTFRKQNKSYPKGKFFVYYRLKLHDDYNWMEGPVTNNKKQKDYVKWEKINIAQ